MPDAAPFPKVLRFGVFELDLQRGQLQKSGARIRLQEKPLQVLAALLERPGELVTREELRQRLWQGDTFVDFNHSVNTAVNKLRDALGDSALKPHFIETVPRRGYRFIFPFPGPRRESSDKPAPAVFRLAVLPLENLSGDPSEEYFVDGMTEELITQLAALNPGRLGVIARTSVMKYKHSGKTIGEIGRELDLDYVVEGSARRSSGRVRINAQLIQVRDQTHIWAQGYDRQLVDVLAVQYEVAHAIASRIRLQLASDHRASARAHLTTPAAYEAYLMGRYLFNKGNPAEQDRVLSWFQQSVDLDPSFAPSYAAIADTYVFLAFYRGLAPELAARARASALKAIELDSRLAGAHSSLGVIKAVNDWDWEGAVASFKQAIELDPGRSDTRCLYSIVLSLLGKHEQAIAEARRGCELDPLSGHANNDLAFALYVARRYDEALEVLQRTVELDPGFVPAYVGFAHVYAAQSKYEQALRALEVPGVRPEFKVWVHALSGNEVETRNALSSFLAGGPPRLGVVELGVTYGLLGEKNEALKYLKQGYEQHDWSMIFLNAYPMFDPLRKDPRFQELLRCMNLPR